MSSTDRAQPKAEAFSGIYRWNFQWRPSQQIGSLGEEAILPGPRKAELDVCG